MKYEKINRLDKKISKLILGNDNQVNLDEAARLWDHWVEVGGNTFDNAYVYGDGSMEILFGKWQKSRNYLDKLVVIAKGAHTPYCDPENLSKQLTRSLERMQIETADIYIMHRDNLDVPVDEFIDVLNIEQNKGRIKIFGGSNWTLDRFDEANRWAVSKKKYPFSILNNNLALCKMINPLWSGCISSNDEKILNYLQDTKTAHLSWSSQGRGYFLSDEITNMIEEKITKDESSWRQPGEHSSGPISCFESKENRERKNRAKKLAIELRTDCQNIAGAWTLNQNFPSFALIGPRKIDELNSSLNNLEIVLSTEQLNWLNLKNE